MTRRGMTMVELVVMTAIASVVIGTVYLIFSAGSRHGGRMEEKLRGVQGAQILLDYLSADLEGAIVSSSRPIRVESIGGGTKNRLAFDRYDGDRNDHRFAGYLPVKRVAYVFDPKSHRVSRDGQPMPLGAFVSVRFELTRAAPELSPRLQGDAVTVVMTTAPLEALEAGEVDPRSTSTFAQTIAFPTQSPLDPLATWLPNYYGTP
ncbi:MAG: hypothetical protein HY816_17200 [Candidatus Wallbacteria bacterium]|nr:hypothetical protein [Candidatus Wallbacteria bacterium]